MAEAGTGHHRQGHGADSARRPGVDRGHWLDRIGQQKRAGHEQEAERHEGVAQMQDEDEGLGRGALAGPAAEPHQLQNAGDESERSGERR